MDEDFLTHYGVLGMKWGRRKPRRSSKSSNRFFQRKDNKETKKSKTISTIKKNKKVKLKDLSDEDLQKKIRRLQMEKQYRDLKKDEISQGRKVAGQIMKNVSVKLGTEVFYNAGGMLINKATKKELVNLKKNKNKDKKDD